MRAAVLTAPGRFRLEEVPRPWPGPGEVRVRLEGCGVCASNLAPWEGRPWFGYPFEPGAPGHEGWGRIDAIGEDVTDLEPGRRVALLSSRAYAEYDLAPATHVLPLPAPLEGQPVPAEPLACAVNVFRRSDIRAGHDVAIVGIGFLGAVLVALAARAGARVMAISRRPFARSIAHAAGASLTFGMDAPEETRAAVLDATGARGADRVIEAAGAQATLDLAAALTRERGRLVIAGYHQDGPRQVEMQLWNWRGLDVINAHERDPAVYVEGMRAGLELLAGGTLDLAPLCTHRLPLDRLDEALTLVRERPDGFLKAVVMS